MRILLFLLLPFFSFSQAVGELDSTLITEGVNIAHVRYLNHVTVHSVYDGDTPTLNIDLGFNTVRIEKFRLYGIQAPEIRLLSTRTAGEAARDNLIDLINKSDYLIIQTFPDKEPYQDEKGKYGRYLGVLYGVCGDMLISLNDQMVRDGFAVYKDY